MPEKITLDEIREASKSKKALNDLVRRAKKKGAFIELLTIKKSVVCKKH